MATISRFKDLEIWQLARQQANELFGLYTTNLFAKDYELRNQISRSSGSVMDNIAEGFERSGNEEFLNYLIIAKGSNGEVRSQLYRSSDRKYIDSDKFDDFMFKCELLSKKITSFIKYLKESNRIVFRFT